MREFGKSGEGPRSRNYVAGNGGEEGKGQRDEASRSVKKSEEKRLKKTGKMAPTYNERITNRRRIDEWIDEVQIRG